MILCGWGREEREEGYHRFSSIELGKRLGRLDLEKQKRERGKRREGEGEGEGEEEKGRGIGPGLDFETSRPTSSGTPTPTRPRLSFFLIISNSSTPWYLSIELYQYMGVS